MGRRYAAGALLSLLVASSAWPWSAPLLWPALALAIVAAGYLGLGPAVYGKAAGTVPAARRWLLGPVLLGHALSLRYYRRRCRAWDAVLPGLMMGVTPGRREAVELRACGVRAVLDLTAESSAPALLRGGIYLNLPVLDLTAPSPQQLDRAVAFITRQHRLGTVYVHCKVGFSRSAAAVGAYLLAGGRAASVAHAEALLREVRPALVIRPEAHAALQAFARRLAATGVAHVQGDAR